MLEADFERFYARDLPSSIWGPDPLTARKLRILIAGLPAEAETYRSLGAPAPGDWTHETELLAGIAELTQQNGLLFLAAHSKEGVQIPKFQRIPRPWDKPRETKPTMATPAEMKAFFGGTGGSVHYQPKE